MKKIVIYDSKSKFLSDLIGRKLKAEYKNIEIVILKTFWDLVEIIDKKEPVLFIVDIFDSNYNEVDLIDAIYKNYDNVTTLVFTSISDEFLEDRHSDTSKKIHYLNKNCSYSNFKRLIKILLKTSGYQEIQNTEKFKIKKTISKNTIINKLSDREKEFAELFLSGISQIEISKMLNLAPTTVNTYKTRIIKKTGNKNLIDFINNYGKFFK